MNSNRKTKFKFTEQQKELLKNLMISQINPGVILEDFNSLIEYIKTNDVASTKSYNYISLKHLLPINNILSRPIKINLKRPQKKSFPNIQGLFLLLRGIGIVKLEYKEKEVFLRINEQVHKDWLGLNDTEAYFTLLETWLIRSNPRDVLDDDLPYRESQIQLCIEFFNRIPSNGIKLSKDNNFEQRIKYTPGLYNIALLELFGFIDITNGDPKVGEAWKIEKIQKTIVGQSFLNCLYERLVCREEYSEFMLDIEYELKSNVPFGQLQDCFSDSFPHWKNNLKIQEPVFKNGTFTFKVILGKTWRRIIIQSDHTLEDFVDIILESYEFDKDHLYTFYLNDQFGNIIEISSPYCEEGPFTENVKVGASLIEIGSIIKFVYDFGDNWEFLILLEDIKKSDLKLSVPQIVEKYGKSPEQYRSWD